MIPERFVVAFSVGSDVPGVPELDVPGEIEKYLEGTPCEDADGQARNERVKEMVEEDMKKRGMMGGQKIGNVPVKNSKKRMRENWKALQEWAHRHGISYIRAKVQNARMVPEHVVDADYLI